MRSIGVGDMFGRSVSLTDTVHYNLCALVGQKQHLNTQCTTVTTRRPMCRHPGTNDGCWPWIVGKENDDCLVSAHKKCVLHDCHVARYIRRVFG
jgi:hypothetical protein